MINSVEVTEQVRTIFDTLDETGTSITEFSRLTTISRATLQHWKRGGYINDRLRLKIAVREAGKLPSKS